MVVEEEEEEERKLSNRWEQWQELWAILLTICPPLLCPPPTTMATLGPPHEEERKWFSKGRSTSLGKPSKPRKPGKWGRRAEEAVHQQCTATCFLKPRTPLIQIGSPWKCHLLHLPPTSRESRKKGSKGWMLPRHTHTHLHFLDSCYYAWWFGLWPNPSFFSRRKMDVGQTHTHTLWTHVLMHASLALWSTNITSPNHAQQHPKCVYGQYQDAVCGHPAQLDTIFKRQMGSQAKKKKKKAWKKKHALLLYCMQ